MKEIRWGIIGCGNVTELKSGPGFQNADGSRLVAVMRRDGDKAEDYARRHEVPKWYNDANLLVNDPDVNAVYVATPPVFHREYTLLAAKAGKPVYVEKPMAMNFAECQDMIDACKSAGVPLFVAYYRRALPRFLKIKELLEANSIGELLSVKTVYKRPIKSEDKSSDLPWRLLPEHAPGGYFDDLAPHTIDILQYFFGPITSASGSADNKSGYYYVPDFISGKYEFESGMRGQGQWYFSAEDKLDRTDIIGSTGKISFSTFGNDPVLLETSNGKELFSIDNPVTIQQPLIQMVVDDLLGKGKCPSTGETGARTNWVMDRILNT